MGKFLFLSLTICLPFYSFAGDVNVCSQFAYLMSLNQDRFDQAEFALSNVELICEKDSDKNACVDYFKKEYEDAKVSLEKSQEAYQKAGCE